MASPFSRLLFRFPQLLPSRNVLTTFRFLNHCQNVCPNHVSQLQSANIKTRAREWRPFIDFRILSSRNYATDEKRRRPIKATFSWKGFAFSMGVLGVFFGGAVYYKKQKELQLNKQRQRSLGKAAIGGKFSLIDHNGKPFTSEDLRGKWVLLYFGFSHCPDICPEEMEKMVKVVDRLEKMENMPPIVPLFITVDPDRDSYQVVNSYIKEFSPKIIGLTGTKEQIDLATKAYRVYYSAGPRDGDNDYIVDHTIIMYLINPDGEFVDYYGQLKSDEQVANGVTLSILKYDQLKKKSWF